MPDQYSARLQWKYIINSKHKWFQPDAILLEQNQQVHTAYLIVRGIVQCKNGTIPTYYKCGNIIGIDALFSEKSLSYGTYTANGGLVETYSIDSGLLNTFLEDVNISRSIYDEIAFHMIMNNYRKLFHLTHSQLQILLHEKSKFYHHQSDLIFHLDINQRLFILSGTITRSSNDENIIFESIQFLSLDSPSTFQLNSSSIIYTWTDEDEIYCSNVKKYQIHFSTENQSVNTLQPFYPFYAGSSIEFTPRRHSLSITRPVENISRLQFIPSEMEVNSSL